MKRLGLWTVLVAAAAVAGGALSYKPWMAYLEQRRITREQQDEMQQNEAKRAALAKQKAGLESHSGRESLAREHGYRKPGEQPAEDR